MSNAPCGVRAPSFSTPARRREIFSRPMTQTSKLVRQHVFRFIFTGDGSSVQVGQTNLATAARGAHVSFCALADTFSLTPCFSWGLGGLLSRQPFQRLSADGKPLKAVDRLRRP